MPKVDEAQKILEKFYESVFNYWQADSGNREHEIHVTDLAAFCLRQSYLKKKYSHMFDLDSVMRMAIGQKLHEIPMYTPGEHEVDIEWNGIKGRMDEYHNGIIIDKKTTRDAPRAPTSYATKQLQYYRLMAERNGLEVHGAVVIYIDVNNAHARAYPVDVSADLGKVEEELLGRRDILEMALETEILPPRQIGWYCDHCECAVLCFGR